MSARLKPWRSMYVVMASSRFPGRTAAPPVTPTQKKKPPKRARVRRLTLVKR